MTLGGEEERRRGGEEERMKYVIHFCLKNLHGFITLGNFKKCVL